MLNAQDASEKINDSTPTVRVRARTKGRGKDFQNKPHSLKP